MGKTQLARGRLRLPSFWSAPVSMLLGLRRYLGAAVILSIFAPKARAQTSTVSMDIPPGFEPVPGGRVAAESVDASMLVVIAYAAFAIGFVTYLVHLARSQSKLAAEIAELGALIGRQEPQGAGHSETYREAQPGGVSLGKAEAAQEADDPRTPPAPDPEDDES